MTDWEDRLEEATTRDVDPFELEEAARHAIEQLELIQYAAQNDRKDDGQKLAARTKAVLEASEIRRRRISDILLALKGEASHKRRLAGLGDLRFNIPEGMLAVPRYRYPYPPSKDGNSGLSFASCIPSV